MERSYFIRFTPSTPTAYSLGALKYVFEYHFEKTSYLIAEEKAAHTHYHIALWGIKLTPETLRYQLKQRLEGQIYISGKEIEDKVKAIAYCIKDGNYISFNLDALALIQATGISKRKLKFDDLLLQAETDYQGDDKKFLKQLIEAHVKTNKKVYMQHIKAQLLLTKLKKDTYGTYTQYLIEKIIDNM